MKFLLLKDKRRRILFHLFEKRRKFLRTLLLNFKLSKRFRNYIYFKICNLPRNSSISRLRNRCALTNRSRGIYKKFGISRIMFRKYIWQGKLIGFSKSSW